MCLLRAHIDAVFFVGAQWRRPQRQVHAIAPWHWKQVLTDMGSSPIAALCWLGYLGGETCWEVGWGSAGSLLDGHKSWVSPATLHVVAHLLSDLEV